MFYGSKVVQALAESREYPWNQERLTPWLRYETGLQEFVNGTVVVALLQLALLNKMLKANC